jgi:hypothetical protein
VSRESKKRGKATGRGGSYRPFIMVYHEVFDTIEYQSIPGNAVRMLHDFAREYNGNNNGNISFADIARRCAKRGMKDNWANRGTRQSATDYLVENGWMIRTRRGGLHMGCDLFAVTWWPVDASEKHDNAAETVPSNSWNKKTTVSKSELCVLKTRTSDVENEPEKGSVVLKTRTPRAKLKAA